MSPWSPSYLLAATTTLPLFLMPAGFGKAPPEGTTTQWKRLPTTGTTSSITNCPRQGSRAEKYAGGVVGFLTKRENARPAQPLPLVKTNLATLPLGRNVMVWLGHSSWYLRLAGKRILICWTDVPAGAAPFSLSIKKPSRTLGGGRKGCRGSIC